uniref:VWFC domain-containing protein n=1 Tax=Oryzias melastigma TaxID=30732 RepID=A0A3B3BK60_ORYME
MIALQQAILTVFLCVVEGGGFMCAEKMPDCVMSTSLSGRLPVWRCVHNGQRFSDGQSWTASLDRCTVCTCQAGEVRCASPGCPELPCVHQVTDPGSCCPRCRGCVYGGEEHSEGSSWFADSTPCMSCQCVDGVTTCSEVHCLSPCVNFLSVPGECCPVCGATYRSYQQWEVDECTSCTCVSGDVHCRTERCPPLTCASVSCRFFCHSWEAIPVKQKHLGFKMYLWI